MSTSRRIGHAPRLQELARELNDFSSPCIGCAGCEGLCHALIDVLVLPKIIARGRGG